MRTSATARLTAATAFGAVWMTIAPLGCFFPDYTFDLTTSSSAGGSGGGVTTSSTTTMSTTTTSSSTSSTATHVVEDCLNGVDDNGDGKIDCEDPDCAAFECVEPVPTGWGTPGYVALYEGASAQSPPDCPPDMPTQVYSGNATINAQPANCSPCDCALPTGQGCELLTDLDPTKSGIQPMQVRNAACNGSATQINTLTVPDPPWGGACFHAESLPASQTCVGAPCNSSVQSASATVTGGTCLPTGGVASTSKPTWASAAVACHGTKQGAGCASPQVCVPKLDNPYKPRVCVEKPGDVECPMGSSFSKKNVYYEDFDDTRDCTGCKCGSASGGTCEITLSLFSDAAVGVCTTPVGSFKAGQCLALGGNPGIFGWTDQVTKAPSGSTCQPTLMTAPFGGVAPKNATTFCCL